MADDVKNCDLNMCCLSTWGLFYFGGVTANKAAVLFLTLKGKWLRGILSHRLLIILKYFWHIIRQGHAVA